MLDDENHSGNRRLSRRTILTGTALMAGAVATGGPTAAAYADDGMPPSTEEPLFDDHEFRYGLSLSATQTDLPAPGVNLFPVDGTEPRWRASQWGTRYTLADAKLRSYPAFPHMPGTSTGYANPGKRLIRGPHGELWVEVFGSAEYDHARLDGEPWPHLLVEQSWDANTFRLTDIKSLKFSIDVRVDHITNMMGDQYDPTRHAAQVTAYFTLVNTIAGSAGNGEMIWFGVPIVDNRYDIPPGYQAEDTGKPDASHQFIDTVDGHEFWDSSLQDWRWHRLRTDLQPYLINAYQTARDRGYLQSTALDDLHITSFNMGWEIPGTFDAAFQFKNFNAVLE